MIGKVVAVVQATALAGALVFVVMLFANEPDGAPRPEAAARPDPGEASPAINGSGLFVSRCSGCHGDGGAGGIGPKLSGGRAVQRFPDIEEQLEVVRDGRGGMPAFDKSLSAEEIRAVVEYTRSQ